MRAFLAFSVLVLLLVAVLLRVLFFSLLERAGPPLETPIRIDVSPGDSFRRTAQKLEQSGLIPSAAALTLWARIRGLDRDVRYGAYEFREASTPLDLLAKMRSGEILLLRVTVPEGFASRDIAFALEKAGLGSAAEYQRLMADPEVARSLGVPAESLEGYLFPDTYAFSPYDRPRRVLAAMTARFDQVVRPDLANAAEASGLTLHQAVTLASIVEKETGKPEERPLIAAVFRNRLKVGMPLQADPTVIYGLENFDGNLTREHLDTPGDYNTYSFAGLPPGPICSPGKAAIAATVAPADVPYLYFVARPDRSHEFSSTLEDHNRAVLRHQKRRRG